MDVRIGLLGGALQTHVDQARRRIQISLHQWSRPQRLCHATPIKRDLPLENICLFNRDALYLRQLKYAVKRGDVGAVLDITTHWMLMFQGTGKMPKYADALFHLIMDLKMMDPQLRNAWLMNWLANLTGKANGFKEVDLLQEHQNFWAKVQSEYHTPFNSISHTSPSAETDIKTLHNYLEQQKLQTYFPGRENNQHATEAHDLMAVGAKYVNKPGAFKNFTYMKYKMTNNGLSEGALAAEDIGEDDAMLVDEEEVADFDLGSNLALEVDDLVLDDDEYPLGTDINDYIART
ncbi:uncharacterized protein LACBIDRAFT_332685 [Laccaria bicolor S238N-H82]|uniref:Predicted protein n=1 Tax=Laccaria bicolor (strain S238N-H82 / ATCC MYA-4686) TaxID=486041 RepID=B0DTJ3_LACBS|nr:uncharacterized protein LACBIDRAFT_332685 [Laccaria bicolor S238N-H82]EDR02124.1 predicted protein [Laccaria bicolor S238N-H82]|eukprot:XP_001887281.1 predicted protein [Laccaria bicolor S238N-H82]